MEQYLLHPKNIQEDFQSALDNYWLHHFFMRPMGSVRKNPGVVRISQFCSNDELTLDDWCIEFQGTRARLEDHKLTVAYTRHPPKGPMWFPPPGMTAPYDKLFPKVHFSKLRATTIYNKSTHLLELSFSGQIDLEQIGMHGNFPLYKIKS